MKNKLIVRIVALVLGFAVNSESMFCAEPTFLEAEAFTVSADGWKVNDTARGASGVKALNGSSGETHGLATAKFTVPEAGDYRIWVRHNYSSTRRGPFEVAVSTNEKRIAQKIFDLETRSGVKEWAYVWDQLDTSLAAGEHTLILSKHESKNCSGYVRNVDCFLITADKAAKPDYSPYGPQTWLRVTLADIYAKPLQIHIFADHYRSPWYGHWHLSRTGANQGLRPDKDQLLTSGETTPWCNITPMLYQDSGAILNITARYTYADWAERLKAKFEFATAPEDAAIVRTMEVDSQPNGLVVVMPPNLLTAENLSRMKRDKEFAEATGKIADAYDWPQMGKKPTRIPFFVSASVGGYGTEVDQSIMDREWKTLDYFGFSNRDKHYLHGGIWLNKNKSFCQPDLEGMRARAAVHAQEFFESGKKIEDIVFCMLTDEPTGQHSSFMVADPAYHRAFRVWLKKLGKTPADLLVKNWDDVTPVLESDRDRFPALHYFTQRFRTRALGDFMAVQREILEKSYGRELPTLVNFSDGATYAANFYSQGVDYFELLDVDNQNAIWSEDWANGASSYQCGAYNVDLMRAAAREHGQTLGHYLVAHAGRKPWDIKTKAASETARGIRIWKNFSYGVSWGSHEGGPAWKSHTWYNHPETWQANAEVTHEIGGAEELLVDAVADPADVAILYSSSSDAWTVKRNHAYGFNRMHTWMALAHQQVPVDFVSEGQLERGLLSDYKVCYVSGPNLTQAAAEKLSEWVKGGGILVLTAGAAMRDEFNRPLAVFNDQLPVTRELVKEHQAFLNSGSYVQILRPVAIVKAGQTEIEVLSVSQKQTPRPDRKVESDAGVLVGALGKGKVYSMGFLPGLSYIKQAVDARRALQQSKEATPGQQDENPTPALDLSGKVVAPSVITSRLERSYNPWEFSAEVRAFILRPVLEAGLKKPLTCSVPLVDAVVLKSEKGIVIPLANYTLDSLNHVEFNVQVDRPVARIESVHQGKIDFQSEPEGVVKFSIPLEASDYLKIIYQ
tara:strand:- start:1103 stop:4147 length:3045 start_codon:yes stop_codon:yes gene_type:complete